MEKRLLVIDDNQDIVQIISEQLLDLFKFRDGANTVEEAEILLTANNYDVIFLDINLENRNGAEVVRFLIEGNNNNQNTPFVIISGIITPQFIDRFQNRFAGILMKPFDQSDIRDVAERLLGLKPPLAPAPPSKDEIPNLKCEKPFPLVKLEQRVAKILEQVRRTSYLKQVFIQMKLDRPENSALRTRVEMIINISTAICMQMDWNTDKTIEKFIYAAYLHDLSLIDRPDLAQIHTLEALEQLKGKLSDEDYLLVLNHPTATCKALKSLREIPLDVEVMISQHHELSRGEGFPAKIKHQKIPPLSVVFIVAHDLTDYILANPKWSIDDYLKKSSQTFQGSQFVKILRSLSGIK